MKRYSSYAFLLALVFFVSVLALFTEIMEPDGALYATIAKTMAQRGDWVNLYARNADWLDKPHLPFWLAALFFKLFGIHAFAYKLPSFLIGWFGVFLLYQFAKRFYGKGQAWMAAIIYATAFHMIISNFDVRAEIYLATFTFAGIYYYYRAYLSNWSYIVPGSFFVACAVMTKGIFVMIPILASFVLFWLFTKQYKELWKWKWWVAILLIGIFILPELYCLYQQFDLHPEKWVFGRQDVSGLRFFFWDSQFGRFFNTGPIKGKGDLSFFLHTTLWAFLPWSILLYAALYVNFHQLKSKMVNGALWLPLCSATITFLLFSFSKFQLPHYIIIIFPQFALISANFIEALTPKQLRVWTKVQNVLYVIIVMLLVCIAVLFSPNYQIVVISALVVFTALTFWFSSAWEKKKQLLFRGGFIAILFMAFAYCFFYPQLLRYQAGMEAGKWISMHVPKAKVHAFRADDNDNSIAFYAPGEIQYSYEVNQLKKVYVADSDGEQLIFTSEEGLQKLRQHFSVRVLKQFDYFHITKLNSAFLNYRTRPEILSHFYILRISD